MTRRLAVAAAVLTSLWPFAGLCHAAEDLFSTGNAVRRYDGTTGELVLQFAEGRGTAGLAFGPDEYLYVASGGENSVRRYNAVTGVYRGDLVTPDSGGLRAPGGLVFGPDGSLYVGSQTNEVLRYDGATGQFLGAFVPSGSGGLDTPIDLLFGPDGHFYVASVNSHSILRYDGTTGAFLGAFVPAGSGGLHQPLDMEFGPDGDLYVTSQGFRFETGDAVLRYDGQTGAFDRAFVAFDNADNPNPFGLTFGPDANLYVAFQANVRRFDGVTGAPLGVFANVFGNFHMTFHTPIPEPAGALITTLVAALLWVPRRRCRYAHNR